MSFSVIILSFLLSLNFIWAADFPITHKISVRNKCKDDFSMVIPGVGIFFAGAGNVDNTYIFYNEFKNGFVSTYCISQPHLKRNID